jgi:hypothetical protein
MAGIDPGSAREEAERLVATALAAARLAASGHDPTRSGSLGPLGDLVSGLFGQSPGSATGGEPDAESAAGGRFATGSPECCVCPICRAIVALRDPSPEFVERLATGAGDLAAGAASLLRAFATATGPATPRPEPPPDEADPAAPPHTPPPPAAPTTATDPAAAATGAGAPAAAFGGSEDSGDDVWRGATRAGHDSGPAPERDVWAAATRGAAGRPVVPAARAPEAVPERAVPERAVPERAVPERDDAPDDGA